MFEKDYIEFDTTSLADYLPIFQEKLGDNIPMGLDLKFKDIKVLFGQFNTDVILEYTACMSFSSLLGSKKTEVLYDELPIITTLDMDAEKDMLFIRMLNNKLDIDSKFGQKQKPERTTMTMTTVDYRQFHSTMSYSLNYFKNWLNDKHFPDGVHFAWSMDEFDTQLHFQEKSMHILLEVNDDAEVFFEDK
jgi:hypothetical protein